MPNFIFKFLVDCAIASVWALVFTVPWPLGGIYLFGSNNFELKWYPKSTYDLPNLSSNTEVSQP